MKLRSSSRTVLSIVAAAVALGAAVEPLAAQSAGTIRGRVVDASTQRPVSGAQVVVQGSQRGAISNTAGAYVISGVPAGDHTVVVEMIGYGRIERTVTVRADAPVEADFALSPTVIALDEVVVTGTAGATQRRALGNTVTTVNAAELTETVPITTVTQLLQGRTPGLTVMSASGQVGTASNFRIRGANSLSASNQPVFYVDGVRITSTSQGGWGTNNNTTRETSPLDAINPDDIESIEVIKGPAAATLYGSDAAAGVIQIITKKGRAGQQGVQWNARMDYGQTDWAVGMPTNYTLCNADRILGKLGDDGEWEVDPADWPGCEGMDPDSPWRERLLTDQPLKHPGVLRNGENTRLGLSARGGGDRYSFYFSGDRELQEGVFTNNSFERISGRANFSVVLSDKLDMALSAQYSNSETTQPQNDNASNGWLRNAYRGIPGWDAPWADGWRGLGPEQIKQFDNTIENERFIFGLTANYRPLDWFRHRLTLGMDAGERTNTLFYGIDRTGRAPFGETYAKGYIGHIMPVTRDYTVDYVGTVSKDLTPDVTTSTSFGMQYISRNYWETEVIGEGLVADPVRLIGKAATTRATEDREDQRSLGFFLEEQIGWKNRLFLTAGVRMDDHSAFGANFERIYYPKVAMSYVVSEEPFFNVPLVSNLKLRAAWGAAGSAPDPFAANRTYGATQVAMDDGSVVSGLVPDAFGNDDLKAERGEEIEVGFDASLFEDNLGIEFTYYHNRTRDALINVPVPPSTGFTGTVMENVGEIKNSGRELTRFGPRIRRQNLIWDAVVTFSTNANKVVSFGGKREFIAVGYSNSQRHVEGYPLAGYWTQVPVRDADGKLVLDGEGRLTFEDDMKYVGPSAPTREASLTNTFTILGNLQLFAFMDYKGGHRLFNMAASTAHQDGVSYEAARYLAGELSEEEWLLISSGSSHNAPFFERADFIKLRELSLRYTLPVEWAQRLGASGMNVSLAGRNLAVWSDYSGPDPEVNIGGSATFTRGDYMSVPMMRQWVASLNFTF